MTDKNTAQLEFGFEGNQYFRNSEKRISRIQKLRERIVSTTEPRTVENTVDPLAEIDILLDAGLNGAELMESVHPDDGMRRAAEVCRQNLSKIASDLELDRALYDAVYALEKTLDAPPEMLVRYLAHTIRDFRRAGVDRDNETRKQIKALNEALVLLAQEFNRNIRDDTRHISLGNTDDLKGLPEDYIDGHKPDERGEIRITTDYPDFMPFMSYAKNSALRRQLFFKYTNRAFPANESVLRDILDKRHQLASLVGHPSFASFVAANKMIGSAKAITSSSIGLPPSHQRDRSTTIRRSRSGSSRTFRTLKPWKTSKSRTTPSLSAQKVSTSTPRRCAPISSTAV